MTIFIAMLFMGAMYLGIIRNDIMLRRLRTLREAAYKANAKLDDETPDDGTFDAALTAWEKAINRESIMMPVRCGVTLLMMITAFVLAIVNG